jgi:hypothetical protein
MRVRKRDFDWAVDHGIIAAGPADNLWKALQAHLADRPRFDLPHVAWYAGALIVIFAMGWFMTEAWQRYQGEGLLLLSLAYAVAFAAAGRWLWKTPGQRVPGGLLVTVAVCMTPMAVFAIEWMMGLWARPEAGEVVDYEQMMQAYAGFHLVASRNYVAMEIATVVAGIVALWFFRFPFLVMPIAVALHYFATDVTELLYGQESWMMYDLRWGWVMMWFGLAMLLVAYLVDRRTRQDFAFWLYLYGAGTFWFGLSTLAAMERAQTFLDIQVRGPSMHLYAVICVGMILLSVLLQRRALIIFGALGVLGYFGWLAWEVFADSLIFPFLMTVVGLAVIWVGNEYRKHHEKLDRVVLEGLPTGVRRWLPAARTPPAADLEPRETDR